MARRRSRNKNPFVPKRRGKEKDLFDVYGARGKRKWTS
jgi:hypothetical protein